MTEPMSERAAAIQAAQEAAQTEEHAAKMLFHQARQAAGMAYAKTVDEIHQRHVLTLHEIDDAYPPEVL